MQKRILKYQGLYLKVMVLTLVAIAVMGGVTIAVGTARTTNGGSSKFDAVEVSHPQNVHDPVCTNSATYTDIPGLTKTVQTGGLFTSPSPAVVAFQAQYMAPTEDVPNLGYVRLVVDGTAQSGSGADLSISSATGPATFGWSWNFFTEPLSSGSHTIAIQWRADKTHNPDTQFCVQNRSMVVWHN